jgi:hypothetical protein
MCGHLTCSLPRMKQDRPFTDDIVKLIRERVSQKRLPCDVPRSILLTHGIGAVCVVCDEPIPETEAAHELEFEVQGSVQRVHLHRRCYLVWDSECLERWTTPSEIAR